MSSEMSNSQNFSIGVIAAFIEGIALQPTLYWKNARAHRLPFTMNPSLIYRGTFASIFNEMQMMGLQFGVTSYTQKILRNNQNESFIKKNVINISSAFIGGVISSLTSSPIELVMIQQQLYGGTVSETLNRIILSKGLLSKGIMRGYGAGMIREGIYVVGMLGITPYIQEKLIEKYNIVKYSASFYASMIGGIVAAVPSHPFDIIKTCQQGDMDQKKYSSALQTAHRLYQEGGIKRFYHGVFWRTINITATIYIVNECVNYLPMYLFPVLSV